MRERALYAIGIFVALAISAGLLLPMYIYPPARALSMPPSPPMVVPAMRPPPATASASALASAGPSASIAATAPHPQAAECPSDMVFVHGAFCPFVAHKCEKRHPGGT